MLTLTPILTQEATPLDLGWTEGDPIALQAKALGVDWSAPSYVCHVKAAATAAATPILTLIVTATLVGADTVFSFTASAAASVAARAGATLFWDCQEVNGLTRFSGKVHVGRQVTAP